MNFPTPVAGSAVPELLEVVSSGREHEQARVLFAVVVEKAKLVFSRVPNVGGGDLRIFPTPVAGSAGPELLEVVSSGREHEQARVLFAVVVEKAKLVFSRVPNVGGGDP